jgi:monomeric sarcosine oxidase
MREVEIAVVGGGVMGMATAVALARRGREVTVLERFEIGHTRGSSHGDARVFRLSYDAPEWVRMMREALRLWRRLEEEAGATFLTITGGLDLDPPPENAAALEATGVEHEIISAAEAMARYPAVAVGPGTEVLAQADAGVVHAGRAWRAFADRARAGGAELIQGIRVEEVVVGDGTAEVRTEEETLRARTVVVTAGAWAPGLLAGIADLSVRVTRETPVYFRFPDPSPHPIVVEWWEPTLYALPSGAWLKAAEHHGGAETDPEEAGIPNERSMARVAGWVRERFPGADPEPVSVETCLYTTTADERFILERRGPVVVGSACSGHAFKFAPLVGERLADLATRG